MDPTLQKQINEFILALNSVEKWLDEQLGPETVSPAARELAQAVREYIARCRRKVTEPSVDMRDVARWRRRVNDACFLLWRSARDGD